MVRSDEVSGDDRSGGRFWKGDPRLTSQENHGGNRSCLTEDQKSKFKIRSTNGEKSRPNTGLFTLRVTNIPLGLDEDGLRTIFSEYGPLINLDFKQESRQPWATVSFAKFLQARSALTALHQGELGLHIYEATMPTLPNQEKLSIQPALSERVTNHKFALARSQDMLDKYKEGGIKLANTIQHQPPVPEPVNMENPYFGRQYILPNISRCFSCDSPGQLRCSRCKVAWYCSQVCSLIFASGILYC